ncbi:MAG: glycosyltransferase family 2 protein [Luteibaculaceae bacterium]
MENSPLVSIIVITYNSAEFVLETLESAKAQTYQNIELIISDDASKDNTVALCQVWLDDNAGRFVRSEIIEVEKNTGIPANCNRGCKSANGEWIKLIAGDDILLHNCISDNVGFVCKNPAGKFLRSRMAPFKNDDNEDLQKLLLAYKSDPLQEDFLKLKSATKQFKFLLRGIGIETPTLFINRLILQELNYFDLRYPSLEDYPFYLKATWHGHFIHFMNNFTVLYRIHPNAISKNKRVVIFTYKLDAIKAMLFYSKNGGGFIDILNAYWNFFLAKLILKLGNKGPIANLINRIRLTFEPTRYYGLKKKLFK